MQFKSLQLRLAHTLDVVIIIATVAVILAAFFKLNNKQIFMMLDKTHQAAITLAVESAEISSDDFKIGEEIYFSESGDCIGTIVDVKNIKNKRYTAINNSLMYDYTDINTGVLIEIKAKVKENDSMIYINSSVFASPGTKFSIYTDSISDINSYVDDIILL